MVNEKRIPKSYKIKESVYKKAKKKTSKPIATFVEEFITLIAEDDEIHFKGVLVHPTKQKKQNLIPKTNQL